MGCSVSDLRHCCNCFRLAVYHGGFQDQWVNQRLKVRKARFTWHAMNSLKFYKLFLYKFITTTTPPGKSRDKTAKLFFSLLFLKYERRKSRHKAVKDSRAGLAEADSHKQLWRFIFLREKSKIDTKCPSNFWCLIVTCTLSGHVNFTLS